MEIYSYERAKELSDGNSDLFKEWLVGFCKLLSETLASFNNIRLKLEKGERVKSFHDLRNYSLYFTIDKILANISSIQSLNRNDEHFKSDLSAIMSNLEKELLFAEVFYGDILENQIAIEI